MKTVIIAAALSLPFAAHADFVHPLDFDGSAAQKKEVLEYIVAHVRDDYCNSGMNMCQDSMLRMMEKSNLKAFKQLTQAKDRALLDKTIADYCYSGLSMCTYVNLNMMYNTNLKARDQKLAW